MPYATVSDMARQSLRRRQFLGMGAAATLGGSAVSCSKSRWRFFTSAEARALDAICEQIIPSDQDAGAREAGVVNYIDVQLARHFKAHGDTYRRGLAAVDALSQARLGRPFADLAPAEQTEVLRDIEKKAKACFDLVLAHTIQ